MEGSRVVSIKLRREATEVHPRHARVLLGSAMLLNGFVVVQARGPVGLRCKVCDTSVQGKGGGHSNGTYDRDSMTGRHPIRRKTRALTDCCCCWGAATWVELFDAVRRRRGRSAAARGDTSEEDEDLGLPRSPCNSPTTADVLLEKGGLKSPNARLRTVHVTLSICWHSSTEWQVGYNLCVCQWSKKPVPVVRTVRVVFLRPDGIYAPHACELGRVVRKACVMSVKDTGIHEDLRISRGVKIFRRFD
uniref:Uncharacterized protein n=1 Tax=Timema poppense TaxID=170557 RepID=A0A7R9CIS5_TIMPO|nr:unnamed protein product [Timema poppensis]